MDNRVVLDAQKVNRLRLSKGWQVGEFAAEVGVHVNTASRVVGGKSVGVRVARQVASVLGVELGELLADGRERGGKKLLDQAFTGNRGGGDGNDAD